MYGTVARMRLKPGAEARIRELVKEFESLNIPGFIGEHIYRMDADSNEYIMAAMFESKELYFANANSPEQDARYRQLLACLEGPPEWHDGEIVYSYHQTPART